MTTDPTNEHRPSPDAPAFSPEWDSAEYEELRVLAHAALRTWGQRRPIDTTELVHEGYLKLSDQRQQAWGSTAQYYGAMVVMIRRALVDAARSRSARKRGGDATHVTFSENHIACDGVSMPVCEVDELIRTLSAADRAVGEVAAWRVFGGFTPDRIAELQGVSRSTIERRWRVARAWLVDRMEQA